MTEPSETEWQLNGLTLNIFCCNLCKNLLKSPVWQADRIGTICNPCYIEKKPAFGCAVPILDLILSHINFYCIYDGCSQKLTRTELEDHESRCPYRTIDCLLSFCNWTGKLDCITDHFSNEHIERIISPNSDSNYGNFVVHIGLISTAYLLKNLDDKYFFIVTVGDNDIPPRCGLFEARGNKDDPKTKWATISCPSATDAMKVKIQELNLVDQADALSDLKDWNWDIWVDFTVDIEPDKSTRGDNFAQSYYDYLKKLLECPGCKTTMGREHILECKNGHSFCQSCILNKLTKCLVCNEVFTDPKQSLTLEAMYLNLKKSFSFKYKLLGYPIYIISEVTDQFPCPLACENCDENCSFANLEDHMEAKHPGQAYFGDNFKFEFKHVESGPDHQEKISIRKLIVVGSYVLEVSFQSNNEKYIYSIEKVIIDKSKDPRIIVGITEAASLEEASNSEEASNMKEASNRSHTFFMYKYEQKVMNEFQYKCLENFDQSRCFFVKCVLLD